MKYKAQQIKDAIAAIKAAIHEGDTERGLDLVAELRYEFVGTQKENYMDQLEQLVMDNA